MNASACFDKVVGMTKYFNARIRLTVFLVFMLALLAACENDEPTPAETRAKLKYLIPATVKGRDGWAADIQYAVTSLKIEPSSQNLCSILAVTEQESTYNANPEVPGLGMIALKEIETRAARFKIPAFVVYGALNFESPNGESWETRIASVRTEKELSDIFEEMIAAVPMGKRWLGRLNPVRTAGPMQVSIAYAQAHAKQRPYPYAVEDISIRHEVFSRRGGMYFGIAHLLDYEASYDKPLFRFADFNAGHYASRNAAFQNAVAVATGIGLDLDGDLIRYKKDKNSKNDSLSATESAVRSMAKDLGMTNEQIQSALLRSREHRFERSELYIRVFAIAEQRNGKPLPHATLPRIRLKSPKITRKLTTEWFATRVNKRYRNCMVRAEK